MSPRGGRLIFKVKGSRFKVQGSGFRVQVSGFKVVGKSSQRATILRDSAAGTASAVLCVSGSLLEGATGVFFTGGDQSRLAAILLGSPVHQKLKELYAHGAVMGGTSAGAAVMSQVMITGEELLNDDKTNEFKFIKRNNVQTV